MEPHLRGGAGGRPNYRRAPRRLASGGVRAHAAGSAPHRPIRIGAPAPLEAPEPRRLERWLVISLLLHAAAATAALAWLSWRDPVAPDPIPIAWVRVEAEEGSGGGAGTLVPPAAVATPPPQRPAISQRAPRRRAQPTAPAAEPAPIATPKAPEPGDAAAGVASDVSAAGSNQTGGGGAGEGHGVGSRGAAEGAAGWMPRGGAQPPPDYPEAARRRGVEGTALVTLRVAASGRVDEVRLHRSAGDAQLDGAALASVRRWRFDPPPPGVDWQGLRFVVPIEFRLR